MIRRLINPVLAAMVIFVAAAAIEAQSNLNGKYVHMYENLTSESGLALILRDQGVAIWKLIEDGEEDRYDRAGTWKLSDDKKILTIDFPKDQSPKNDLPSEPFKITFEISENSLIVKTADLPGIRQDETVFKKEQK